MHANPDNNPDDILSCFVIAVLTSNPDELCCVTCVWLMALVLMRSGLISHKLKMSLPYEPLGGFYSVSFNMEFRM